MLKNSGLGPIEQNGGAKHLSAADSQGGGHASALSSSRNAPSGKAGFLAAAAMFVGIFGSATPALAAPFACTGEIYQVQSGQLRKFDASTSTYTNVGGGNPSYNAIGYNVADNYFYGVNNTDLVRIHSNGTMEVVTAGASPIAFPGAGDVAGGRLWVKGSTNVIHGISLTGGATVSYNMSGPANISDFIAINNAGTTYLVGMNANILFRIQVPTVVGATATVTQVALTGPGTRTGSVGAMWTDLNGRVMGFYNLSGNVYEITNVFGAPVAALAAQGDPSSINDGGSCSGAAFPNLQPIAQPDSFTTPFQTAVSGNVLTANPTNVDSDPEGTALTVTTAPVVAPANGSVTIAANGAFTYTPNAGFYGTDTFQYRITDAFGGTDTAIVTITVPAPAIDLVTVKTRTSANANPLAGETVTFQIAVTNNGLAPATGVSLTDLIPAGLTATANNGAVSAGTYTAGTGLWTIGTLAAGATATLTIEGTIQSGRGGTTITNNTTAATGAQTDPSITGDDLTEAVPVFLPVIAAVSDTVTGINGQAGTSSALNVLTGDTNNAGAATTSNVTIALASGSSVPAGLTFSTGTGAVGVNAGTPAGTYTFNYTICDTMNPTNCSTATASVTVAPSINLQIVKSNGVNGVILGSTVSYSVTVTNAGPDASTGALITDVVGAHLNCPPGNNVAISGSGVPAGTFTIANLTGAGIALGTLATGQSAILTYSCQVN